MIVFFLIYLCICFFGMRIHRGLNEAYLSVENTRAVKGIFILLVFFSHFNSYASFTWSFDVYYAKGVALFGQTMVTLFLFYSGYGVMESIQRKGRAYLRTFPVKRILGTLFLFVCAVVLYYLVGTLIAGERYAVGRVLLSLIGWEALGNSNWYIFVILVLYLITYLSHRWLWERNRFLPLLLTFLSVAALILLNLIFKVRPLYWIDTAFCYVAGMLYARYRKLPETWINKNGAMYGTMTLLAVGAVVLLKLFSGHILPLMALNLSFAATVVLLTMRVTLKNKVLLWCGEHLFEIYILQRLPMIVWQRLGVDTVNVYLYFILSLGGTLLLVWPFRFVTGRLWRAILSLFFGKEQV